MESSRPKQKFPDSLLIGLQPLTLSIGNVGCAWKKNTIFCIHPTTQQLMIETKFGPPAGIDSVDFLIENDYISILFGTENYVI